VGSGSQPHRSSGVVPSRQSYEQDRVPVPRYSSPARFDDLTIAESKGTRTSESLLTRPEPRVANLLSAQPQSHKGSTPHATAIKGEVEQARRPHYGLTAEQREDRLGALIRETQNGRGRLVADLLVGELRDFRIVVSLAEARLSFLQVLQLATEVRLS